MDLLPQVWDLVSALEPVSGADPDEVDALAAAEQAAITCADRVRGALDAPIRMRLLCGTVVSGVLTRAHPDGVVVAAGPVTWVVRFAAVARLDVPLHPPVAPTGTQRGSLIGAVRGLTEVVVATSDGAITPCRLDAVGADHLLIGCGEGPVIVPWVAVAWVRSR